MVFKVLGESSLDSVVNVRLTTEEKARLKIDAVAAGISMSELVRAQYFNRKIVSSTDTMMINELRRIGGLLKHIHNDSAGAYSTQTSAALNDVQTYIRSLSAQIK